MVELLLFVVGFLLALLMTQKPLNINIHHKIENIVPAVDPVKMSEYEKELEDNKVDKTDDIYKNMGEVNDAVADVFGGSDRI